MFKHVSGKESLKRWVDSQNVEGFTALHFAAFHGNYSIMNALVEEAKADMSLANKSGCTVLHLAAQGNRATSIYYFAGLHWQDINVRDSRKSTPLHWACFTKSEAAQNYIMSIKGVDLDAQDENGLSPLHIAVQSVETLKSTRPVKALLLRGASRTVRDNKGRTPSDLIGQGLPKSLRSDL